MRASNRVFCWARLFGIDCRRRWLATKVVVANGQIAGIAVIGVGGGQAGRGQTEPHSRRGG